jgi:hypothetical protein
MVTSTGENHSLYLKRKIKIREENGCLKLMQPRQQVISRYLFRPINIFIPGLSGGCLKRHPFVIAPIPIFIGTPKGDLLIFR